MAVNIRRALADNINAQVFNNYFKKVGLFYNGTEISGAGYQRATASSFAYDTEDTEFFYYVNTGQITFPQAGSNWGNVNQVGFFDNNNVLQCIANLNYTIVVNTGNQIIFYPNTLILRIPKVIT